jgi:hypothetical protein
MRLLTLMLVVGAAIPLAAQDYFQRHHITAGLGAAAPREDLQRVFRVAPAWSFAYGYRPLRYLQGDVGFDTAYKAGEVNDFFVNPSFGYIRIRDFQFFVPLGGRVVLPVAKGRAEIFGGGGGAYLRYTERARQPSDYVRVECPECRFRDGWGYYAQAGGNLALDRNRLIRLGALVRMYQGDTSGQQVGALGAARSNDRWVHTYLTLTFSF